MLPKQNYRYDDEDQDLDEPPSPAYLDSSFKNKSVLNINVEENISDDNTNDLLKLLKDCLGTAPLQIKIKNYNDAIRNIVKNHRERLEENDGANFATDEDNDDEDDASDAQSVMSGQSGRSSNLARFTKTVEFPKRSDLIILQTLNPLKIRNVAYSKGVTFTYTEKGYKLRGEDENSLQQVENMIRVEHANILPVKMFLGHDIDKIKAVSHTLMSVTENLKKQFGLHSIYMLTSEAYYRTYKELAKKVPELKRKLDQDKTMKTNLRIVLLLPGVRKNTELINKFTDALVASSNPFEDKMQVQASQALDKVAFKLITKLATQAKFYIKYEFKSVIDKDHNKMKNVHEIILKAYYTDVSQKGFLAKKANLLKDKIRRIMRPRVFYNFIHPRDKDKYYKFVHPEILDELKEKNVTIQVIQQQPQPGKGHFAGKGKKIFNPRGPQLSLSIEGEKESIQKIKQRIQSLLMNVKAETYKVNIPGQFGSNALRELKRPESISFLKAYFDQFYAQMSDIKLVRHVNKRYPLNKNKQLNDNPNANSNPNKNQAKQDQIEEDLEIIVLYKDTNDLNTVKNKLNEIFGNISSKLQRITEKLITCLPKAGLDLDGFKSQYHVMASDFFDSKTNSMVAVVYGEHDNLEAATAFLQNIHNASKPIKETVQVDSQVLMQALRNDFKALVNKTVSIRFFRSMISLSGEPSKVKETKEKIQQYLTTKRASMMQTMIEDVPSSHIKLIEDKKKWFFDLQRNNQVQIRFAKPTSSKINMKIGVEDNKARRLVLVDGDIVKIQADAIVNSTNLNFGDGIMIQGVTKSILDKAGEDYIEECQSYGELKETNVFVSGSGNLSNYKNIINVCPPLYRTDNDLTNYVNKLKLSIKNVLREVYNHNFQSIAFPFISAGNFGIPATEAIISIIEELAAGLFTMNSQLKEIFICEIEEEKVKIAEQKIKSLIATEQLNTYVVKYQWQWLDDSGWTNYDLEVNRKIDYAFSNGQKTIDIRFPSARSPGTHTIDLTQGTMLRKSIGARSRIQRKPDGWYEDGTKLPLEVSEIIDLFASQGKKIFDIFLNEYNIDLAGLTQVNKATNFSRKIQKTNMLSKQVAQQFVIPGLQLKLPSSLRQGNIYGKIIVEGFSTQNIQATKEEVVKMINSQKIEGEVKISSHIGEENLKFLIDEIKKHQIKCEGELKPGKKAKIYGIRHVIIKLQNHLRTIDQTSGQVVQTLPPNWESMDSDTHFALVPLNQQNQEWKDVSARFAKTMEASKIVSVQRIQNSKFWKDFCQEKESLQNVHQKYGLDTEIKEMFLWHGTCSTHPQIIYDGMEECFDMQYAQAGMWGRGLYFAVNASYSNGYAHNTPTGTRLFMLCRVMIGDTIMVPYDGSTTRAFIKPPTRNDGKPITYDSVQGYTGESDVFMLYRMRRAYPEYLIEYKI